MDRYAVIGNPVEHSLSPRIHAMFAEQTGETLSYERLLAPLGGFAATVARFFSEGGRGANVTVPFKVEAAAWVDTLEPAAAFAAAVNTIVVDPDGRHRGFNTDGPGLVTDLERLLGRGRRWRILVVGAGGAVRGVVGPLAARLATRLVIANRTPERAQHIVAKLRSAHPALDLAASDLGAIEGTFDIVINGTSAGLEDRPPGIPSAVVAGAFCYDMVYGGRTAFCRWALDAGARDAVDGIGMLVEQAALAFTLWRGVRPETAPVRRALGGT